MFFRLRRPGGQPLLITYPTLEINPYGLGSRIQDIEAERGLRVITDILFLGESLVSRTGAGG